MDIDWVFQGIIALGVIITLILNYRTSSKIQGKSEGSVDTSIKTFENFMDEVRKELETIRDHIVRIFDRLPSKTATNESPIKLNDLGKEISQGLNLSQWAEILARKLVSEKIPALENRSHYQIQEYCFEIVEEKAKSADMENKIEESAYRKGLKKSRCFGCFS